MKDIDLFWNGDKGFTVREFGELNRLLDGPSLFEGDRFKKVKLTECNHWALQNPDPEGLDLLRF